MLPTEELFVYVYVLVHDLILAGPVKIPRRPGPAPDCTDAELLAIDRKSTRLNSSHIQKSRMPSSA